MNKYEIMKTVNEIIQYLENEFDGSFVDRVVDAIVSDLLFMELEIEEMQENGEATSLYDYFNDVLDFEYTINRDKTYKAVKIWVTLGGPNICIDTNYNEIRGFWGSDRESAWLPSEIAEEIDSIFEELYNC